MKKGIVIGVVLLLCLLVLVAGTHKDAEPNCLEQYQAQAEQHGGNGGIVGPRTLCGDSEIAPKKTSEYIVAFRNDIHPEIITSVGGQIKEEFPTIQVIVADLNEKQVKELQKDSFVKYVEENQKMSIQEN